MRNAPLSTGTLYEVVDAYSSKVMGAYKSRKRATSRADALDMQYGAVRYVVRYAGSHAFASRFGA